VKKVSKTKIALTYATALLEAAVEKKAADKVFKDVVLLRQTLKDDATLVGYMTNPLWAEADKISVLQKVAQKLKIGKETLNCLDVITENRRWGEVIMILDEFVHIYYQNNNMVEVVVDSAKKMSSAQSKKLTMVLEKKLAQKVVLSCNVYPELIGGLRIRIGSKMFDDTITAKLNSLENMMKGDE